MSQEKRIYVDVHVLQTVPPSCVNRDDTGSPKTAVYGGALRARVSSQSWKHAMRQYFKGQFKEEELALRTKKVVTRIADAIKEIDPSCEDAAKLAEGLLNSANLKPKKDDKNAEKDAKLDALFFISEAQVRALAKIAVEDPKASKNDVKKALAEEPGVELALFGRMVADDTSLNVDACAQVAHAISTHRIEPEYDYFTAVDDIGEDDNAGAGHIGSSEFDSATFYRYATVAVHNLDKELGKETASVVGKFVEAFVKSMPTGKQNSFANRTLPDAVLVIVRRDQPVNLVGAFEKPIIAKNEGFATPSEVRLSEYAKSLEASFAGNPEAVFVVGQGLKELAAPSSFPQMIEALEKQIATDLAEE